MIFTYNLLFGFLAVLGSIAIQMAMFVVNLLFVRPSKVSNLTNPSVDQDIYAQQKFLWNTLTFTHLMCSLLMTLVQRGGRRWFLPANASLTVVNLV